MRAPHGDEMMNRFVTRTLVICCMMLGLASDAAWGRPHDLRTVTHWSEALGREATFGVYVPADLKPLTRYPVLFVLHGAYGSHTDWPKLTDVLVQADRYQMILVFPDGGEFGWYVDSPIDAASHYESYITRDLVAEVDRLLPTVGTRTGRGIMGLSMGGHGALSLAAKHPELFGSASSLSGILRLTNHPDKWEIALRLGTMEESATQWKANSVYDLAERLKGAQVSLLMDCGVSDEATGAIVDNRETHARLKELGVPHIYREFPGGHSWAYWQEHLPQHLNFHQAAMAEATASLEKWPLHYFKRLAAFAAENALATLRERPSLPVVAMVGSSSTEGFPAAMLPGYAIVNRGISSDTLGIGPRGVSRRLEESVFDLRPDVVVIKEGRNDLGDRARGGSPSLEAMVAEYAKILGTIKERLPETRVILCTAAPVGGRFAHLADSIVAWNVEVRHLAKTHGATLVDLHPKLVGANGLFREELTNDGLHLTKAGNEIWADQLLEALQGLEAEGEIGSPAVPVAATPEPRD